MLLSLLWKYGAVSWVCLVVEGLVSFIFEEGSFLDPTPLLKLEITGDILGEYLADLGVRSLWPPSSSLGRYAPNRLVDIRTITILYAYLPTLYHFISSITSSPLALDQLTPLLSSEMGVLILWLFLPSITHQTPFSSFSMSRS